jgi:hypothetical protein
LKHIKKPMTCVTRPKTDYLYMIAFILVFCGVQKPVQAMQADSFRRHSVKLDMVPLYSVLFDVRKQVRLGVEYQVQSSGKQFRGIHLDAGLYDDYTFYKYYDLLNQSGGLYYVRQDVKTYGFHALPEWHYWFSRLTPARRLRFLGGITADVNMFEKKIKSYNSRTQERYRQTSRQARLGLGVHLAAALRLSPFLHIELKAVFIAGVIKLNSETEMKSIKPYKAVWFDDKQNFWFIPQINIAYDF